MGTAIFYKGTRYPTGSSGGGGGSGGSSTICSTNPPTSSEGSNGDLYFYYKVSQGIFDYLKFEVTQTRTRDGYVQFSELKFLDSNNNSFNWSGSSVSCNKSATGDGDPNNILDGNTASKTCIYGIPNASDPTIFTITLGNSLDIGTYNKWQWWTGGDAEGRDPIDFSLYGSVDGTEWVELDNVEGATVTTNRQALGYEKTLSTGSTIITIKNKYVKIEGQWVEY